MRLHRLLRALFLLPPLMAQQPADTRPPDTPAQRNLTQNTPLNPALPTLFIVGDSTARNGPDLGWGDHLAPLFDTARINIANRAAAGRSSRTFINEGKWSAVLAEMKPGDFLLLQMGHNDGGDLGGAKPRGTLKGAGDESQDVPQTTGPLVGQTETVHTFGWYLRKYIDEARTKGVSTTLLTLTVRNVWKPDPSNADANSNARIERDMGYTAPIREVAAQEHLPVADMGALAADTFEALGPEKTAALFPLDHTHTSPQGAAINAQAVADALRQIHSPVAAYLKP